MNTNQPSPIYSIPLTKHRSFLAQYLIFILFFRGRGEGGLFRDPGHRGREFRTYIYTTLSQPPSKHHPTLIPTQLNPTSSLSISAWPKRDDCVFDHVLTTLSEGKEGRKGLFELFYLTYKFSFHSLLSQDTVGISLSLSLNSSLSRHTTTLRVLATVTFFRLTLLSAK